MSEYFRPLVQYGRSRPAEALPLAGGPGWFSQVEVLSRSDRPRIIHASDLPEPEKARLTSRRDKLCGISMSGPHIMGILNVTPDSFSDGGRHEVPAQALARGRAMVEDGALFIDVGGESTRPGAQTIPEEAEIARTEPVIRALASFVDVPISIDTRKAAVAEAAHDAGAQIVNDVSGLTYDKGMLPLCRDRALPICVMHALGDPETMQENPRYDDVLLDVFDFLAAQVIMLEQAGFSRDRILVDPGIGFGKTLAHNLTLLNRVSLFHAIGCPVLIGASRKKFIGTLSGVLEAQERVMGSVAVALAAAAQGVQVLRVHDVKATRQALALWLAVRDAG